MKTENKARVAIITRTKNRPIMLERAFKSVFKQSFKNIIWVVVNDGGDRDETEKVIIRSRKLGLRTIFISNSNSLGMEAASNCGINASDSEFITIHDDDDTWHPEFLEKTIEFLDKNIHYKGVVTLTTQIDEEINGNNINIKERKCFNPGMRAIYISDMGYSNLFPPISFIYYRSIIKEIGEYNNDFPVLGDWDFNLRFLEKHDIGVIYEELAFYHHRPVAKGIYGNTIYDGVNKHIEYDAIIRNKLIRQDLITGKFGLGCILHGGRQNIYINGSSNFRAILLKAARKIRSGWNSIKTIIIK